MRLRVGLRRDLNILQQRRHSSWAYPFLVRFTKNSVPSYRRRRTHLLSNGCCVTASKTPKSSLYAETYTSSKRNADGQEHQVFDISLVDFRSLFCPVISLSQELSRSEDPSMLKIKLCSKQYWMATHLKPISWDVKTLQGGSN